MRRWVPFLSLWAVAASTAAAPNISAVQGTFGDHQTVTVAGSGFGSKNPAAPLVWDDFNQGLNPGSGSIKRVWDQVESMIWSSNEGVGGTGCAKAADGNGLWTLRCDYNAWTNDGQRAYIYKKEKLNFLITPYRGQNYKTWRMWPVGNGYPNIYSSASHGRIFVEKVSSSDSGYWANIAEPTTNWSTQEIIFQASTINQKNGRVTMRYDGRTVADGSVLTRSSSAPTLMQWNYVVHGVAANASTWSPSWSNGNRMWDDDVYVDTTWSRVMLGNANTFSACNKLEIQIPIAWNDGSIQMMARTGDAFSQGSTAYLYVFDRDGNVNSQGFAVRIGARGAGAPPEVAPQGSVVASAGPDSVAAVNADIRLQGSISGAATSSSVSARWTKIDGPGNVTFSNPTDPNSTARFSSIGEYTLQFAVNDGTTQSSSNVRVSVVPSSVGPGTVSPKNVFNPEKGETYRIVQVLNGPGPLSADILDRTGHLVRSIDGGDRAAGEQVIEWDGRNSEGSVVASGIYVVVVHANGRHATGKVAVIK